MTKYLEKENYVSADCRLTVDEQQAILDMCDLGNNPVLVNRVRYLEAMATGL